MSQAQVDVRELAAWDLDPYDYRPNPRDLTRQCNAHKILSRRELYKPVCAIEEHETARLAKSLEIHRSRPDLQTEMAGLDWSVGVVDLRSLLAFQRRLSFDPAVPQVTAPAQEAWDTLTALSFASSKPSNCAVFRNPGRNIYSFQTSDPNLHLRFPKDGFAPIVLHAGSPFFEVAEYRGRWFLRDGYHRAFHLLSAGVSSLPAVIVRARTLEELGATQPWFFSEEVLFSATPPHVTDFLDDSLVLSYTRPRLIKTLHLTVRETFTPASRGEQP